MLRAVAGVAQGRPRYRVLDSVDPDAVRAAMDRPSAIDAAEDLDIPGTPYSFRVLERAQAVGDFQSLDQTGRRAIHVHLPSRDPELFQQVTDRLLSRFNSPELYTLYTAAENLHGGFYRNDPVDGRARQRRP